MCSEYSRSDFVNMYTSDYALPSFATWRRGPIAVFCHFRDFGNFLANFLAHFDPWTICDNSLQ